MASAVKAVRPNRLTENETLSTFEDWRNNLEFYLQQENSFNLFLQAGQVWSKHSEGVDFRGLDTAIQARSLNQFLGVIASLSPPLLHGDIINDTTKLDDVYKLLRSYYQFAPSESTFVKFAYIKREIIDGKLERPLHLYLRMRQFVRDNLLLSSGRIHHDGVIPTTDESFSPTTERLIVLRWLETLHPLLPNHITNVFAHDLQTKSLKDLQPQISDQVEELLMQVEGKSNELDAQFTRLSTRNRRFENNTRDFRSGERRNDYYQKKNEYVKTGSFRKPFNTVRKCQACQAVGEPFIGHEMRNCPNIAPSDRSNLIKNFNLEIDSREEDTQLQNFENADEICENEDVRNVEIDRVNIVASPKFNVKINKTMITMLLDTGATGSMITLKNCELAGLRVYPSSHTAVLADGDSRLHVVGEIHTSIIMENDLILPLDAVVVTKLKAGLIVGMNFMRENKVIIDVPNNRLNLPDNKMVNFSNSSRNPKIGLLRAEVNNVIFPGDSLTVVTPANFREDINIAIEPRVENDQWPSPCIVENKDGYLSIVNHLDEPIKLKRNQVIAQLRSVEQEKAHPVENTITTLDVTTTLTDRKNDNAHTQHIVLDPDEMMTQQEKMNFEEVHTKYCGVFNLNHGTYNDKSGKIRASVLLGNTKPAPKKGKVPSYCSNKAALLQEKFNELEALGILSHPEDVQVEVLHTSPSFLVKKTNGSHRLVTSFVELNKYILSSAK